MFRGDRYIEYHSLLFVLLHSLIVQYRILGCIAALVWITLRTFLLHLFLYFSDSLVFRFALFFFFFSLPLFFKSAMGTDHFTYIFTSSIHIFLWFSGFLFCTLFSPSSLSLYYYFSRQRWGRITPRTFLLDLFINSSDSLFFVLHSFFILFLFFFALLCQRWGRRWRTCSTSHRESSPRRRRSTTRRHRSNWRGSKTAKYV